MRFDLSLDELSEYRPAIAQPPDFDAFWRQTLAEARQYPLNAVFEAQDFGLATVESFDVTYNGYGGQPIKGWLLLPRQRQRPLPCVVEYIGYGGGRGFPLNWLLWSSMGYAHLVMDTRGQGFSERSTHGDTPDIEPAGSNPQYPGFMTRGILSPYTYYYRRLFTDAVRAVETARAHPAVDGARIALSGASQGGGIAIAVAGLDPGVQATMPDVPFLCHFPRATQITDAAPYSEIVGFCKAHRHQIDKVFQTLSYFDGIHFAQRSQATALFSVALMDLICPPSTVFAAYNHYAGSKDIKVYDFNNHEGGGAFQLIEKVQFLQKLWK